MRPGRWKGKDLERRVSNTAEIRPNKRLTREITVKERRARFKPSVRPESSESKTPICESVKERMGAAGIRKQGRDDAFHDGATDALDVFIECGRLGAWSLAADAEIAIRTERR